MPLTTYSELGGAQKSAGSIREDLMDFLEILSPRDCPLFNNLGSIAVHAGFVEYLEDTLLAAATNSFVEGAAATDPTLGTPSRNASIVQNFQKHWQVAGRTAVVNHAGLSSMISYQEMKAARELKTDIELALHRGSAVSGTTTVAPQLAGLLNKITTNFTHASGVSLTETFFNDHLAKAYQNPVNLREGYVGMSLKRQINRYTTSVTRYMPAESKKQLEIIDVYEAEMGVIALFKSRYQFDSGNVVGNANKNNSYAVIDPDYFQVGWLRPLATQVLGLDGDRERRFMVGELTLIVRSEKAGVAATGYVSSIT